MTAPNIAWYVGTTKWSAVSIWTTGTVTAIGTLRRQTASLGTLTVGNERVFVCVVAGTTHATTEPTWVLTKGATTTDNTVTWQECTGQAAVNGDNTNTPAWSNANVKNTAIAKGLIIHDVANSIYLICTTAGTAGNGAEPTWNATAGATTADNTATWTSLGVVGNFTAIWAAPCARLQLPSLATWSVSGDTVYVSNNHAETQTTGLATQFLGTAALPINIICVNDTAAPPTSTATTATVTTTGASVISISNQSLSSSFIYIYGISFSAASGAVASNINILGAPNADTYGVFDTCNFTIGGTNGGSLKLLSGTGGVSVVSRFVNCKVAFSSTASNIDPNGAGPITWIGGSIAATGTVPTTLLAGTTAGAYLSSITFRDVDISAVTGNLVTIGRSSGANPYFWNFQNCKLGSGVTITTGSFLGPGSDSVRVENCDSSSTNYRIYLANYMATLQQETTIIRTGGASDGTTALSWNIVSTANSNFYQPFISEEIAIWNDVTGSSKTATIEINSGGTLTNGDVWVEIEYLGSSTSPVGSLISSRKSDILQSNTNITTSSATWAGSLAGSTPQKLQVTFTPQMKGPVKARIYVAKSQTVYIDPLITLT